MNLFKKKLPVKKITVSFLILLFLTAIGCGAYYFISQNQSFSKIIIQSEAEINTLKQKIIELESADQVKINKDLKAELDNLKKLYTESLTLFEKLVDLHDKKADTKEVDKLYANFLSLLSKNQYAEALKLFTEIDTKIADLLAKSTAITNQTAKQLESLTVNNTPPGAGYARQKVTTDTGDFIVSIVSADLGSTRVIVDTASDSTCTNDCPVLPLATYVSRSGAFAGVNGSYFCPASYPSCAGKTNSFDLLVMNSKKTYFNSDNNVYSNNPGVVFGNGYVRFLGAVSEWGRDTGIDGMLSNYPLLVRGGNIVFGGDDDPKKGSKGNRSFVATKGSTVYIGVVHSATVAEAARVLAAMGMGDALNLDDGGSTALWSGGYKVGPGRDLPNVILFVKK